MEERTVPGFHGAPAMAVLPFDNLSGDPEQEYFADGIAEDLITRLSALRANPIIARNSSFTYKGKAVDVKQVSRELGVRYVVEGSVRKAGNRVRISAQLIDATTGAHIWAERYDRELVDIFAVQDEITEAIAGSMRPGLSQYEREHASRRHPRDLNAWDCLQRGWWHCFCLNEDDNSKARSLFERAADLDPSLVGAFVGLAWTHFYDLYLQWTESPERSLGELVRAAEETVTLNADRAETQLVFGMACFYTGQLHKAITAFERAVELDPSDAAAHALLGAALSNSGRPDEAIASTEKAMRLSPHDPVMWMFLSVMGVAHFVAERYEEAVRWLQRSLQRRPDWPTSHRFLAASYAHLGRFEEARAAFKEMQRRHPEFSLASVRLFLSGADSAYVERYIDGLRKAGLKE
jgi:adenylate cyclase